MEQLLVPVMCKVDKIIDETPDIRTYRLKMNDPAKMESFTWMPGQFVEFSLLGHGECTFCISSSSTRPGYFDCSIKRAGVVTADIHSQLEEGMDVGSAALTATGSGTEDIKGKNLLFVGGGIGLAPSAFPDPVLHRQPERLQGFYDPLWCPHFFRHVLQGRN
jgi:sulfhydrogenase subunit gamma (sulfur reductase)